jgi:putative NADPH-quinone reductase
MDILVILAHPTPGSFNHAIAETVVLALEENSHSGVFHDLYAEGFDPRLPTEEITKDGLVDPVVEEHCGQLAAADSIVIVHPNWWGMPPAILKGWVDRVMRPSVAYEFEEGDSGEGIPVGLLKAKTAVVFTTSNTHEEREQEVFGDPLENLWKTCIFDLCGVKEFYRRNFEVIVTSTEEERKIWLREVEKIVAGVFPPGA